jgi:hypothetical protein
MPLTPGTFDECVQQPKTGWVPRIVLSLMCLFQSLPVFSNELNFCCYSFPISCDSIHFIGVLFPIQSWRTVLRKRTTNSH